MQLILNEQEICEAIKYFLSFKYVDIKWNEIILSVDDDDIVTGIADINTKEK